MNDVQTMVADVMREAIQCGYSLEKTARVLADAFEGVDPSFDRDSFEAVVEGDQPEDDDRRDEA